MAVLMTAVVVVLILPPLVRARGSGNALGPCSVRLRFVCQAMGTYAVDHGGTMPDFSNWPQALLPYLRPEPVLTCDLDHRTKRQGAGGVETSYTMNWVAWDQKWDRRSFLRLPAVGLWWKVPVLFDGDALCGDATNGVFRHPAWRWGRTVPGLNVGYADGHVRWTSQPGFTNELLFPAGVQATRAAWTERGG